MKNIIYSTEKVNTSNKIILNEKLFCYDLKKISDQNFICEKVRKTKIFRTFSIFQVFENITDFKQGPTCIKSPFYTDGTFFKRGKIDKIHIGIDTEYQQYEKENKIISYQIWIYELNTGFVIITRGKRIKLQDILEFISKIVKYKEIVVLTHFSRAEIQHFEDREKIIQKLKTKNVRKTFIILKSKMIIYDEYRHGKTIKISLYDTFLLSNTSLKNIGGKIDIGDDISDMERLLKRDINKFLEYSITDAKICVEWYINLVEKLKKLLNFDEKIIEKIFTASSIGEKAFLEFLNEKGIDKNKFLGKEKITEIEWNSRKHKLQKVTKTYTKKEVKYMDRVYYGGRNECYFHGIYNGNLYDYDIKNAYPSAMLTIQDVDWNEFRQVTDINSIQFNDIGYARVYFKFKKDVEYPIFPVKTEYGLVFPQSGETDITLQELYTALQNDWLEKLDVKLCVRFKKLNTLTIPEFTKKLIEERAKYPKGTVENMLFKLIANSLYGKFTQGVKEKKSVNLQKSSENNIVRDKIKPSKIFNPAIASYITGCVRSIVGEYMNYLHKIGVKIFSVTTDGFMTNKELSEGILHAKNERELPFSSKIAKYRDLWLGDRQLLELKHKSENSTNFILKTRMYWMYDLESKDIIIARGGIQAKGERQEVLEKLTDLYFKAYSDIKVNQKRLSNVIDFFEGVKDLVSMEREVIANFDYDLKRKIDIKSIKEISTNWKGERKFKVSFETRPYKTIREFYQYKRAYENYKRHYQYANKIQKKKDLLEFLQYTTLFKYSDTIVNIKRPEHIILNKIIWLLGKKGYSNSEISKLTGMNIRNVRKRIKSKSFELFKEGKIKIKKIQEEDYELFKEYFLKYTKKMDVELKEYIHSNIFETTKKEREKTYEEVILDIIQGNYTCYIPFKTGEENIQYNTG